MIVRHRKEAIADPKTTPAERKEIAGRFKPRTMLNETWEPEEK
jgi:hypothetical protein